MADFATCAAALLSRVRERDAQAEVLSRFDAAVKAAELAMFDAMVDDEIGSASVLDYDFAIDSSAHYSCLADKRTALYEALKPYHRDGIFKTTVAAIIGADEAAGLHESLRGAGIDNLFDEKFTVHAGTLQAAMREWDDGEGIPEEVRGILSVFNEPKLNYKPTRKRR